MEHGNIRHKLSEYIDGSVTDTEKAEIEAHVRDCPACSDALRELLKTLEHIKTVEEVKPTASKTGEIMAGLGAEEERKKPFLRKLFLPIRVKLSVQALALLFLTIIAIYLYRNIPPPAGLPEAPSESFSAGRSPSALVPPEGAKTRAGETVGPASPAGHVAQRPAYKSLDMRLEYELPKPAASTPQAVAPFAPVGPASRAREAAVQGKKTSRQPTLAQKRAGPSADVSLTREATKKPGFETGQAKDFTPGREVHGRLERIVLASYKDGKPSLVETRRILDSRSIPVAEERFDEKGNRHGIQREYYESGQVKVEAAYSHGNLVWRKAFDPAGKELSKPATNGRFLTH